MRVSVVVSVVVTQVLMLGKPVLSVVGATESELVRCYSLEDRRPQLPELVVLE